MENIISERLILRHLNEDDAESIFNNWANDDQVTKFLTWPTHTSVEITKHILSIWLDEYKKGEKYRYGITLKESNELIGMIDVVEYIDGCPEIGYVLSRKHWNNGYMSEAFKAYLVNLKNCGFKRAYIRAVDENIGSNKVILKNGFTLIDTIEKTTPKYGDKVFKLNRYYKDL